MARIRTIKPEFFTSLTVASLSVEARLTFIGLWTHVDDDGRCVDDTRLIRAALWALDDRSFADVDQDLTELVAASLIHRYEAAGRRYLSVCNWLEHQRINRPTRSKLPAPGAAPKAPKHAATSADAGFTEPSLNSMTDHGGLTDDSLAEGKGKEGKGTSGPGPYVAHDRNAREPEQPPTGGQPGPAERILADWIASLPGPPQRRIVTDIGRHVADALRDGQDPAHVAEALRIWQERGNLGPGALPSIIHEVSTRTVHAGGDVVPFRGRASPPASSQMSVTGARMNEAREAGIRAQAILDARAAQNGGPR